MKRIVLCLAAFLAISLTSCGDTSQLRKKLTDKAVDAAFDAAEKKLSELTSEKNSDAEETPADEETTSASGAVDVLDWSEVGLPKANISVKEQVLQRAGYVASYNEDNRIPNWVMWRLTADHTTGAFKREGVKFTPDEEVSNSPTTYDYQRTGYDRGHMCPSADNRWSAQAQQDCFLMTNICPQNHNLNTGDWSEMENQCRRWAEELGEIYIICGPILFRSAHKKIAKSIVVPEAFFKVVYCPKTKKAIGFIYRNEEGDRPKGDYVNTVDQVERIAGFDFFPSLPAEIQEPMEAEANLSDWGL